MGKRKHSRLRQPVFTPLSSQKKEGSKLKGPLATLSPKFELVDWLRDLLPEHLWIAALAEKFGLARMVSVYKGLPVVDLLPKYPGDLTEDERYNVESFARNTINMTIQHRTVSDPLVWPKYFWRHNYDLLPCQPAESKLVGGEPVSVQAGEKLTDRLRQNATAALQYLVELRSKLRIDLYDPRRDEVLFGLFARLTRLYVVMAEDPFLWARDVSGIMLRPLAETAITFSYLAKVGSPEDFNRFIEYGEGQQKLLMLHLQDNYPNQRSLDGLSSEQLAEKIELWPEMVEIELGSWSKKDARRLAQEAGLEDLYRLVFTPASSDLHGS